VAESHIKYTDRCLRVLNLPLSGPSFEHRVAIMIADQSSGSRMIPGSAQRLQQLRFGDAKAQKKGFKDW